MSHISKENIDYWFFRYTEGTLSVQEKEQFMNYLLENPQYTEEFLLWTNTKVAPELDLVDHDLEKSMLKKMPAPIPPSSSLGLYLLGVVAVVACTALGYLWGSHNTALTSGTPEVSKIYNPALHAPSIAPAPKGSVIPNKLKASASVPIKESPQKALQLPRALPQPDVEQGIADTSAPIQLAPMAMEHMPQARASDTLGQSHNKIVKPLQPKVAKKKYNGFLFLKPARKFQRDNKDF